MVFATEHYFEMSRPDSERALEIYKTFTVKTTLMTRILISDAENTFCEREGKAATRVRQSHPATRLEQAIGLSAILNHRDPTHNLLRKRERTQRT